MVRKTYDELVQSLNTRLRHLQSKLTTLPATEQTTPESSVEIEHTEAVEEELPRTVSTETSATHRNHREELPSNESTQQEPNTSSFHILADRKTLLKQDIRAELRKGQQPTASLKKQFVDQERKCSKASFYRYIQELKQEQNISVIRIGRTEYCVLMEK